MAYAALTTEPLNSEELKNRIASAAFGAYVTFVGSVRDNDAGRSVESLTYTAYEEMAASQLQRIADESNGLFSGTDCAVAHRIGSLRLEEASVAIVVGAPHRAEAFDACRWLIDTIKKDVPIWKKESFDTGSSVWIEGSAHVPANAAAAREDQD